MSTFYKVLLTNFTNRMVTYMLTIHDLFFLFRSHHIARVLHNKFLSNSTDTSYATYWFIVLILWATNCRAILYKSTLYTQITLDLIRHDKSLAFLFMFQIQLHLPYNVYISNHLCSKEFI